MYGLLIVDSGFFVKPNDDINDVFSTVFCDNPTASEFHMARIKIMQEITHGLALYFESILVNSLNKLDVYVYSFDEFKQNNSKFGSG